MGGAKIRSEKFQAPKRRARGQEWTAKTNTAHVDAGLNASSASSLQPSTPLKKFKQEYFYPEICKMSDTQCSRLLQQHGVLPSKKKLKVECWERGSRMQPLQTQRSATGQDAKDVLACSQCRTPSRTAG